MKLLVTKPAELAALNGPAKFSQAMMVIQATILAQQSRQRFAAEQTDQQPDPEAPDIPVPNPPPPASPPEIQPPTPNTVPIPDPSADPDSAPSPSA